MKRKGVVLLLPLVLFIAFARAQEGSVVHERLKKQYDSAVYKDEWGENCYKIKLNGFVGCCDKNGKIIVPPTKYTRVRYDKDDKIFKVKIGEKFGLLNEHGSVLVEADKYTFVYWDEGNRMYEVENDDKAGLLDEHGNVLVEADKYTWVYWDKDDKVYYVNNGDKAGLLDEHGNVLVEADKYTWVYWDKDDKVYYVNNGDKAGLLDENGNALVEADKYTKVYWDKDDKVYYVKNGDKAGLLDENGKVLIEPVKGSYVDYYDKKTKCYIINQLDSKNNIVAMTLYSPEGKAIFDSKTMKDMGSVSEGMIAIKENELWGYMDVISGKMVIPAQYTSAEKFEDGVAKVSKGNESFLISHPLRGKGSEVLSSLSVDQSVHSDIEENIFESSVVHENTFVVVLSVQNYSDFVVPFAMSDGKVFRQYCEKSLGIPKSNIQYYENATLNNIHGAMTWISDLADAYEGDAKIIFYFAGQGISDNLGNPYLMPSDASLNMIAATSYSVEKLYRELGSLDVQSAIVLLDAGFTNENREGKEVIKDASGRTKMVPIIGKVIAFTASSEGETAYIYKDKGHGMFTYFLCKKINESKGDVNLKELYDYVKTNVSKTSSSFLFKTQTPLISSTKNVQLQKIKL